MSYNRKRNRNEVKAEINIIPFLDVLLVLLLIFMATAPIISQSVQVDLPESTDSENVSQQDTQPIILEVAGIDEYTLIIKGERHANLTKDEIISMSTDELAKEEKSIFLVGGARNIPYEEVIRAIDILHDAGIRSVGLMTSPL